MVAGWPCGFLLSPSGPQNIRLAELSLRKALSDEHGMSAFCLFYTKDVKNLWGYRVGWTEGSTDDRLLPEGRRDRHAKSVWPLTPPRTLAGEQP